MVHADHYATLGIPRNASRTEIRKAYRTLVRRLHPDLHPGDAAKEEALKQINEAYAVLSDPEKRRKYMVLGTDWEETLRDDAGLRGAAGFAPRPESSRSGAAPQPSAARGWSGPRDARLGADISLVKSVKGAVYGFMLIAFALFGIQATRHPRTPPPSPADTGSARVRATMSDLHGALALFHDLAEEGPDVWERVCEGRRGENREFLEQTLRPNYDGRYQEGARRLVAEIRRSESAGVLARPLPRADQAALRTLIQLRADLEEMVDGSSMLDCRNSLPLASFNWQARVTRAAADSLSTALAAKPR